MPSGVLARFSLTQGAQRRRTQRTDPTNLETLDPLQLFVSCARGFIARPRFCGGARANDQSAGLSTTGRELEPPRQLPAFVAPPHCFHCSSVTSRLACTSWRTPPISTELRDEHDRVRLGVMHEAAPVRLAGPCRRPHAVDHGGLVQRAPCRSNTPAGQKRTAIVRRPVQQGPGIASARRAWGARRRRGTAAARARRSRRVGLAKYAVVTCTRSCAASIALSSA
jgi:hypothetical protein